MKKREWKDQVYRLIAGMVKSLANAHRLEIIDLLAQGEFSVEQIAAETNLSVANASQHLQVLRKCYLAKTRRDGNHIYYMLADPQVYRAWTGLRNLAQVSADDLNRLMFRSNAGKNSIQSITLRELLPRLQRKEVVLLDVRPSGEYSAGHIPAAINTPVEQLKSALASMDRDATYVAYCRGPFCVFADEAVALLLKSGFKAVRMYEGYPDFVASGGTAKKAS